MSNLKFIFVHGLSGWGSYDSRYRKIPYWGMRGGDLIVFLKKNGVRLLCGFGCTDRQRLGPCL